MRTRIVNPYNEVADKTTWKPIYIPEFYGQMHDSTRMPWLNCWDANGDSWAGKGMPDVYSKNRKFNAYGKWDRSGYDPYRADVFGDITNLFNSFRFFCWMKPAPNWNYATEEATRYLVSKMKDFSVEAYLAPSPEDISTLPAQIESNPPQWFIRKKRSRVTMINAGLAIDLLCKYGPVNQGALGIICKDLGVSSDCRFNDLPGEPQKSSKTSSIVAFISRVQDKISERIGF